MTGTGYQYQGEEIDLVLRGEEDWFRTQDISTLPIYTPRGQLVPLNSVARVEVTTGPEQINHIERSRAITIQVIPPETIALETALDNIQNQIVQPLVLYPPSVCQLKRCKGSISTLVGPRVPLKVRSWCGYR